MERGRSRAKNGVIEQAEVHSSDVRWTRRSYPLGRSRRGKSPAALVRSGLRGAIPGTPAPTDSHVGSCGRNPMRVDPPILPRDVRCSERGRAVLSSGDFTE